MVALARDYCRFRLNPVPEVGELDRIEEGSRIYDLAVSHLHIPGVRIPVRLSVAGRSLGIEQSNHCVSICIQRVHVWNKTTGKTRIERIYDDVQKLLTACERSRHRRVADDRPLRISCEQVEDATRTISPSIKASLNELLITFCDINFLCRWLFLHRQILSRTDAKSPTKPALAALWRLENQYRDAGQMVVAAGLGVRPAPSQNSVPKPDSVSCLASRTFSLLRIHLAGLSPRLRLALD